MKIALCTTTIHVPHALKLMRKINPDVPFFVAVDKKTPGEVHRFVSGIDRAQHYFHGDSEWKCSEAIGFNTLARRNIAFLEALKWGADVIYSWDNDNLPTDRDMFLKLAWQLVHRNEFNGIKVSGAATGWFDPGALSIPAVRHRGIPIGSVRGGSANPVVDAKIGVMAGLILGDPDIDATTRMEIAPRVVQTHLLGQTGVVVDPHTWTVFNSQNTAVIRELIPAWFMMPGVGRHDDIYASLIVQRVARERDLHVHFGPPFTYQQRNEHNLITDLRAEIDGMENVSKLAAILDSVTLTGKSVIGDTQEIYEALEYAEFYNGPQLSAAYAWLADCEGLGL